MRAVKNMRTTCIFMNILCWSTKKIFLLISTNKWLCTPSLRSCGLTCDNLDGSSVGKFYQNLPSIGPLVCRVDIWNHNNFTVTEGNGHTLHHWSILVLHSNVTLLGHTVCQPLPLMWLLPHLDYPSIGRWFGKATTLISGLINTFDIWTCRIFCSILLCITMYQMVVWYDNFLDLPFNSSGGDEESEHLPLVGN